MGEFTLNYILQVDVTVSCVALLGLKTSDCFAFVATPLSVMSQQVFSSSCQITDGGEATSGKSFEVSAYKETPLHCD